jgi:hypothetical protein
MTRFRLSWACDANPPDTGSSKELKKITLAHGLRRHKLVIVRLDLSNGILKYEVIT